MREPWVAVSQLEQMFEVRTVAPGVAEIDADIDLLVVAHPKSFSEQTVYAIDQFIMAGGNAIVLVDSINRLQREHGLSRSDAIVAGGKLRLRSFTLEAKDADVIGDEPIWHDGQVVGWVTSGGYAHGAEQSVALGYVPVDLAESDGDWQIELLGKMLPASLQRQPLFDANGSRMRS